MKITIEPYNSEWPVKFNFFKEVIADALGDKAVTIDHIGSTSIAEMCAKPVIDILVGVGNEATLSSIDTDLIAAGFTYIRSEKHILIHRRTFFKYEHDENITAPDILDVSNRDLSHLGFAEIVHVHCWIWNSEDWVSHIAFRDYLRTHEDAREEYRQLKEELSKRDWESTYAYSRAKDTFMKETGIRSMEWYLR